MVIYLDHKLFHVGKKFVPGGCEAVGYKTIEWKKEYSGVENSFWMH